MPREAALYLKPDCIASPLSKIQTGLERTRSGVQRARQLLSIWQRLRFEQALTYVRVSLLLWRNTHEVTVSE
jgi:hypothetical protein